MLNLSRNSGTYDGAAFFQDDSGIAEKKIPLNRLVSWENQPFQPYTDEALESLPASIEENGLLSPIIVTPAGEKYRIIAGHNRVRACEKLGWTEINAVIKETDEDHAQLMMLDTNLCQRHSLSPLQKPPVGGGADKSIQNAVRRPRQNSRKEKRLRRQENHG